MSLMIKDIPVSERPRERLIKFGKESLSNSELFDKFVKDVTGSEAKPEVKELFLQLMGEALYAAD